MFAPDIAEETADRQAIADLLYRYCRSMDRRDAELGYTVWHDDATVDYGPDVYVGSGRGFIDWVTEEHLKFTTHSHQITNIIIELDGDRAASEAYVTVALRFMDGAELQQITGLGRYLDKWSRRDGRWAIDRRVMLMDLDEIRTVTPLNGGLKGSRDRQDASYGFLAAGN
jgi:hypothetical protein